LSFITTFLVEAVSKAFKNNKKVIPSKEGIFFIISKIPEQVRNDGLGAFETASLNNDLASLMKGY
jgi:hypothetical protein